MSPRTIRAYLRGATAAKVIESWKPIGVDEYHINPYPAPMVSLNTWRAVSYCRMLKQSGVEPLYVDTEILGYAP